MTLKIQRPPEGEIPFDVPQANKPCHTWYKVVGNLQNDAIPLITLHGGPGVCHELLAPLGDLNSQHGIPVIFYDQIGNGKSTHFREFDGDESFWTAAEDMFVKELDNLVEYFGLRTTGFDLYGQSWGGMLGARYASLQPKGLRKLVIANSPASVELVLKGEEALRAGLPKDVRETIERCEREGREDSKEYQDALKVYKKRHMCRLEPPLPEEIQLAYKHMAEDPTVGKMM
jgi:proline-specific peptidase